MRRAALFAMLVPALAAASVPVPTARETIAQALARTGVEAEAARLRVIALEKRESIASDEASRLRAERQRAAAAIALTEAQLAIADLDLITARAALAAREARLARDRAPLAALLAGLVTVGRRPPVLALADGTSISEMVRVRALVDVSLPLIEQRSALLKARIEAGQALAVRIGAARQAIARARARLATQQAAFAALERRAETRAAALRSSATGSEDQFLAGSEALLDLESSARTASAAARATRALTAFPLSPPRPFAPDSSRSSPGLPYSLPTSSAVVEGLGAVSAIGVRSRGIRFATPRGSEIRAPAAGRIIFAAPYRDHDGIIVIDHGNGWTSLLVDVAPRVERGQRVAAGSTIGRALGDVVLELRERGEPRSASLIAGSSDLLSNGAKTR